MKTTLHIDMDVTRKDLIKTVASSRGLSMKKYLMSLVDRDIETNRPLLPTGHQGDQECEPLDGD